MLHPKLIDAIQKKKQELQLAGELIPIDRLEGYYALFREKFGPQRLRTLDGEALLTTMHDFGPNGMVYWLEFKNDEEFRTKSLGSIAGGSALKFGLWRRKEDEAWTTGKSTVNMRVISVDEAVEIARRHRDQLIKGVEMLSALPVNATEADYQQLQRDMNRAAPDVADTAWGHKYFHLLFPDKLDDYHVVTYQHFHLVRLLQTPPAGEGRFLAAPSFVRIARELNMPINHLARTMNEIHGEPYHYWRIGSRLGAKESIWELMRDGNIVAIGWEDLGDLSHIAYDQPSLDKLRDLFAARYPNTSSVITKKTREVFDFVNRIQRGDRVLAADGNRVLGIGRVTGPYQYVDGSPAPHRRPVKWLSIGEWPMLEPEGLQTTVHALRKPTVHIEIERHLLDQVSDPIDRGGPKPPLPVELDGVPGQVQSVLDRKKQVILYGPPGTGKTYWARLAAQELAARSLFNKPYKELDPDSRQVIYSGNTGSNGGFVRMCTFHPAYGYEDFLEGYRPHTEEQQLVFELRDGIFKRLCAAAAADPSHDYFLIIDEVNRGDIPRIFGELLTLLEKDKRGVPALLPLSGETFAVPPNVYIIATMNTADRSIALLDTALRRRFGFIELMPDTVLLKERVIANSIPLGGWLEALNKRILENIGRDARNLQVGHAYFLDEGQPVVDLEAFARVLRDDIIPLLQEYCYEDYSALARILGKTLVNESGQRIQFELFEAGRSKELMEALLETAPDLAAAEAVVISDATAQELEVESEEAAVEAEA